MKSISDAEYKLIKAQYAKNVEAARLDDEMAKNWQDLDIMLKRSGVKIETGLIRLLTPLTHPIEKFSGEVADFLSKVELSSTATDAVKSFGKELEKWALWLGGQELDKDAIKGFIASVENFAKALDKISKFLGIEKVKPGEKITPGQLVREGVPEAWHLGHTTIDSWVDAAKGAKDSATGTVSGWAKGAVAPVYYVTVVPMGQGRGECFQGI